MSLSSSRPTGQWLHGPDGPGWWFDSGSLALDFAYSGAFPAAYETLGAPEDLAHWLEGRFDDADGTVTARDLADAKGLRDAIARVAVARSLDRSAEASDIDVINLFAATPDIPPALSGGTRQAGRGRARVGQALSALARDAVELFGATEPGRIRECAAADCDIVFYDESRSNNRRWCSMQRCGNRAKVRAHRAKAQA